MAVQALPHINLYDGRYADDGTPLTPMPGEADHDGCPACDPEAVKADAYQGA